jgi:Cell division protein
MAQEDKVNLSKKGKREVSSFIGHELLYDYLCNTLDPERTQAVADHLKYSRDAQLDLGKIQNGQTYADSLAKTVVSQPVIEQINHQSTYLTVLLQKTNFAKWPQGLKWGLEALVVVGVVVSLLTVAPWEKIAKLNIMTGSKEVILAEVDKPRGSEPEKEETPEFVDEGIKKTETPAVVAKTPAPTPATTVAATPTPAPAAKAPVHEIPPPPAAPAVKVVDKKETTDTAAHPTGGGFLYRGEIDITGIQAIGPKLTEKIKELGGRKAGDVELGWQKTPGSLYYHFTLPEAKYPELETFLATYGKARISKEKHPRVMPDGIIRLILTVDEATP